jgi:hypothetical protein
VLVWLSFQLGLCLHLPFHHIQPQTSYHRSSGSLFNLDFTSLPFSISSSQTSYQRSSGSLFNSDSTSLPFSISSSPDELQALV